MDKIQRTNVNVRVWLKNDAPVEPRYSKDGITYCIGHKAVYLSDSRYYITTASSMGVPEDLEKHASHFTIRKYISLSGKEIESGRYKSKDAEAQMKSSDLEVWGNKFDAVVNLFIKIMDGKIRPYAPVVMPQGGLSRDELEAKVAQLEREASQRKHEVAQLDQQVTQLSEERVALSKIAEEHRKIEAELRAEREKEGEELQRDLEETFDVAWCFMNIGQQVGSLATGFRFYQLWKLPRLLESIRVVHSKHLTVCSDMGKILDKYPEIDPRRGF